MTGQSSILVTGGAGFVGSHFVHHAHETGSKVVVLDDLSGGPLPPLPRDVVFVRGDFADSALVRSILRTHEITAITHFAGKIQVGESVADPAPYFHTNLVKTLTLLDVVVDEGPIFVFSSTAAVYGAPVSIPIHESAALAPVSPYGMSKLGVEHALASYGQAHGLRWAALRYFNAAGAHPNGRLRESHEPETHLIPLALDAGTGRRPGLTVFGTDYSTPDGTCVRDYVHVCDLAAAHLAAIDVLAAGRPVGAVNLGSGTGASVREVLESCARVVGRPVPHQAGPRRDGDPPVLLAGIARAAELLGWTPKSSLLTIIEDAFRSRA